MAVDSPLLRIVVRARAAMRAAVFSEEGPRSHCGLVFVETPKAKGVRGFTVIFWSTGERTCSSQSLGARSHPACGWEGPGARIIRSKPYCMT